METRNISLTREEAKEWYDSNIILRDIALKAFTKEELEAPLFKDIKSFKDACKALHLNYDFILSHVIGIAQYSQASAAMFKLNIVRKALNLNQELHLTENSKDSNTWYPVNPLLTENATHFRDKLKAHEIEVVGKIKNEGKIYEVLGGMTNNGMDDGLSDFCHDIEVGFATASSGFLGCASKEIAQHFSNYFGMLITEAKYGDLPDFEIVDLINRE